MRRSTAARAPDTARTPGRRSPGSAVQSLPPDCLRLLSWCVPFRVVVDSFDDDTVAVHAQNFDGFAGLDHLALRHHTPAPPVEHGDARRPQHARGPAPLAEPAAVLLGCRSIPVIR